MIVIHCPKGPNGEHKIFFGSEKKYAETNWLKRLGYAWLGEVAIPGRLRAYHVIKKIRDLKLPGRTGLRVLDAGSGRGDLAFYLGKKFKSWRIRGLELCDERLAMAQTIQSRVQLDNVQFVKGDLLSPAAGQGVDLITCCDVLEHIQDDVNVMRNFYDRLDDDGLLILTFPSVPQRNHLPLVHWRDKRLGISLEDSGHVRQGYSIDGIRSTLESIRFRDVTCQYTFGFWGTLCFDLFFVLGDNKPNPFVFLTAFPFLLGLAWLDVWFPSKQGSALIVTASK